MKNIRIKEISPTKNYLSFVKLVKHFTDLGLKETKDICDKMRNNNKDGVDKFIELSIKDDDINVFIDGIRGLGGEYLILGDVQWERNFKMLSIGLGDKSDYSDFIKNHINDTNVIDIVLENITKKDLVKIFNKIKLKYDSYL